MSAAPSVTVRAAADPVALAALADAAVESFRSQALGQRLEIGAEAGARVRVVVSSSSVRTDPSRLEVWVLLGDVREDRVPPRWNPNEVEAGPELTAWARRLTATAIGHFAALDWPLVEQLTVRFDVAERVERRGGWRYVAA